MHKLDRHRYENFWTIGFQYRSTSLSTPCSKFFILNDLGDNTKCMRSMHARHFACRRGAEHLTNIAALVPQFLFHTAWRSRWLQESSILHALQTIFPSHLRNCCYNSVHLPKCMRKFSSMHDSKRLLQLCCIFVAEVCNTQSNCTCGRRLWKVVAWLATCCKLVIYPLYRLSWIGRCHLRFTFFVFFTYYAILTYHSSIFDW